MSPYVTGILLIIVLSVTFDLFPVFGLGEGLADRIYHLTLPAIALALALTALLGRVTRASLSQALNREYVETARSRGFSERRVVLKHAMRSALIPVVTVMGVILGYLISGAVLVEYTFGLNGLGALLVDSVLTKDFAVAAGGDPCLHGGVPRHQPRGRPALLRHRPADAPGQGSRLMAVPAISPDGGPAALRHSCPAWRCPTRGSIGGAVIVILVVVAILGPGHRAIRPGHHRRRQRARADQPPAPARDRQPRARHLLAHRLRDPG